MADNTEFMDKMRSQLHAKAEKKVVDEIQSSLRNYAKYKEMKELYNKVLPQLSAFEENM